VCVRLVGQRDGRLSDFVQFQYRWRGAYHNGTRRFVQLSQQEHTFRSEMIPYLERGELGVWSIKSLAG
jgi:hypothetical protein